MKIRSSIVPREVLNRYSKFLIGPQLVLRYLISPQTQNILNGSSGTQKVLNRSSGTQVLKMSSGPQVP